MSAGWLKDICFTKLVYDKSTCQKSRGETRLLQVSRPRTIHRSRLCQPEINVCTLYMYVYSYPEPGHLRQETSDTVVTPSIPDMTLAVVELNDSAKRVSFISATAAVVRMHCKIPGNIAWCTVKKKLCYSRWSLYMYCTVEWETV
jgi:hypothetical protein